MTEYRPIESYWGYVRWNLDEWNFWKKYNKYKIGHQPAKLKT